MSSGASAAAGSGSVLSLQQMLTAAEPRGPAGLPQPDPGAVLGLACHCMLVQSGFKVVRPAASASAASNNWLPAPKWATEFKDEWVFRYTYPGKRNELALHCSLQRASGRMLVHGIEVDPDPTAPRNSQLLGLQLDKYVPERDKLRDASWDGVVQNDTALLPMLQQHVFAPLLEAAADLPTGALSAELAEWSDDGAGRRRSWLAWLGQPLGPGDHSSVVVPAVLVTAVALGAVAAYVVMSRRVKK